MIVYLIFLKFRIAGATHRHNATIDLKLNYEEELA
jgi:hypothetical protein